MAAQPWFKCINPKNPAMTRFIDEFGDAGLGCLVRVLAECQVQGTYSIDFETFKSWAHLKSDRAKKLWPLLSKILEETQKILSKSQEISKNLEENSGNLRKSQDFTPSNPRGSTRDLERIDKRERIERKNTVTSVTDPPKPKFEERHLTLATEFWELVHEKYPYYKPPKLEAWAVTIRKMEEIDGFTIDEIEDVAAWALTKSEFWSQQIRGPDNLRKHFTKLLDQSGLYAVWERQRNGITTQGNYNRTNP